MRRIKDAAQRLVKRHRTNNPFIIAMNKGIIVHQTALLEVLGYHKTYKRQSVICLEESLDDHEKRFVCAHELGHAVLHPKVNTPFLRRSTLFSIDKIEREANQFAIELLVPDEDVYATSDRCATVHETAVLYGVPTELMHLKSLE